MRRRTVAPWALSIVIAVAGVPVDRVGSERGIKQIMKCVWNTQQESFTCSMRVYIDEDLPEIVAENERIDITPGGWGVDPNNGTCSDCMTPYPQFEDDPPEEVFDEIDQCGGSQADERDIVRAEYVAIAPGLGWVPSCQDFATTGGTAHFGWNELSLYPGNEHVPLAIVKAGTELENTQVEYGFDITITGGYRCPNGNNNTTGASPTSSHMRGTAFDMRWNLSNGPWVEEAFDALKGTALANGFTNGLNWTSYADHHLHVSKGGGS